MTTCWMLSVGVYLQEVVRDLMWDTAIELLRVGESRAYFKCDHAEGVIETERKVAGIGEIFGYVCKADVETEKGTGICTFIVRFPRSGKGHWRETTPYGITTTN